MKTRKKIEVNRKFLLDVADRIYNSKQRSYLRLCEGTLQGEVDPKNPKRVMHCGLGELYYQMTGNHPEQDGVNEDQVCDLAVDLSPLGFDAIEARIQALGLSADVTDALVDTAREADPAAGFRETLNEIPTENDDGGTEADKSGNPICTTKTYQARARRVAAKLREAAALLPA
jgi:hypothetical protein